jgi:hypothetical protein
MVRAMDAQLYIGDAQTTDPPLTPIPSKHCKAVRPIRDTSGLTSWRGAVFARKDRAALAGLMPLGDIGLASVC